jgi:hypothetical protein
MFLVASRRHAGPSDLLPPTAGSLTEHVGTLTEMGCVTVTLIRG